MSESLFATAALKINDSPGCREVTISGDLIVIRDYGHYRNAPIQKRRS